MEVRDRVLSKIAVQQTHALEDLSLAVLALRRAPSLLLSSQLGCGAWPPYIGHGPPSVFHTSLALLAIRHAGYRTNDGIDRAFHWLESTRGIESHWFWRWKFRLVDQAVRFDPMKSGWPWFEGTISWVAPTSMAILAYRAYGRQSARLDSAIDMLLDRACPSGGWNAGNSVVMGVPLEPHPDFTAMALLALGLSTSQPQIPKAIDYLGARAESLSSAYSLAWTLMALAVHRPDSVTRLRERLCSYLSSPEGLPVRTLALCALALEDSVFDWSTSTK